LLITLAAVGYCIAAGLALVTYRRRAREQAEMRRIFNRANRPPTPPLPNFEGIHRQKKQTPPTR
jgi:hypothetical protein